MVQAAVIASNLEAPSSAQRERDLVDRHRRGDEQAFEEFYQQFSGMIYNLTLRYSGNPELARDLSQEVLLRIYRSLGKFKGRSSLKTWTYRVCINLCRSRLGRRTLDTYSLTRESGAEIELTDPRRGPEERAIARSEVVRLGEALPRIDPVYREALLLRDLEGLSYQEIAEVLNVPIGTVRSRIARGRERLRRELLATSVESAQPERVSSGRETT